MANKKLDGDFFEVVVIYNLLTNPEYLGTVIGTIQPEFFNNKSVSTVVSIICDFFSERGIAPTVTEVKSHLDTDDLRDTFRKVVGHFSDIDKKFNKEELYENTERFLKERAVYNTMLDVAGECNDGDIDTSKILDKFEQACNINLSSDVGLEFFSQIDTHIEDLRHQEKYIPSTWEWLDRKLGGGFLESGRALYLFAGGTNVGKSIFLGNIATNVAAQGKTVVLISLEMSELMYAKRISTNVTQIPIGDLNNSADSVKSKVVKYKESHPDSKLYVKEFPPNAITASQLSGYLQKLIHKGIKPDMVVLDYINLLHCPIGNNSYERVKHAAEQVRALSYTFECPFITATQINRSGLNEINPGVECISESIGLAATADCIFSIWQEEGDNELGLLRLGMVKNRYGQNFGSCNMSIDYTTLTLSQTQQIIDTEEANEFNEAFSGLADN
jgi:replicative DNA helicase